MPGNRVFAGSEGKKVYALDAKSGCIYWIFDADFPVRSAVSVGPVEGGWAAFFGSRHANAYAVNALTGKLIWKTQVDEFPAAVITGAPTLADGRLYVPVSSMKEGSGANLNYECCKFRGSVSALDASSGKVIWKSYMIAEVPRPVRCERKCWRAQEIFSCAASDVGNHGPREAIRWDYPVQSSSRERKDFATGLPNTGVERVRFAFPGLKQIAEAMRKCAAKPFDDLPGGIRRSIVDHDRFPFQ